MILTESSYDIKTIKVSEEQYYCEVYLNYLVTRFYVSKVSGKEECQKEAKKWIQSQIQNSIKAEFSKLTTAEIEVDCSGKISLYFLTPERRCILYKGTPEQLKYILELARCLYGAGKGNAWTILKELDRIE